MNKCNGQNKSKYVIYCRADASACVYKTALGGVNRGYHVVMLKDCIFSLNETLLNKMLKIYEKAGIDIKERNDFLQSSNNINE